MPVKSQMSPPVSTRRSTLSITPLGQGQAYIVPLQTASQRVTSVQRHDAVVFVPHATALGERATVHAGGARHSPLMHCCAALHARPHAPQWALLVLVSMQNDAPFTTHSRFGAEQVLEHCELVQSWPTVHAAPQRPQCSGLDVVSTHAPSQRVCPARHSTHGLAPQQPSPATSMHAGSPWQTVSPIEQQPSPGSALQSLGHVHAVSPFEHRPSLHRAAVGPASIDASRGEATPASIGA